MHRFWASLIEPLLDTLGPEVIAEVGSGQGRLTERLLDWADARKATVHAIDPTPADQAVEWEKRWSSTLTLHRARSLNALGRLQGVEVALLDGDPNWYTVSHELAILELVARNGDHPPPVVVVHGVDGPRARRDGYYDPRAVPDAHRLPYEGEGHSLDAEVSGDDGDRGLARAIYEHPLRNGVRTAVEDFLAERSDHWTLHEVPGDDGAAVLASTSVLSERPELADFLERLASAPFLRERLNVVESARRKAQSESLSAQQRHAQAAGTLTRLEQLRTESDRSLSDVGMELEQAHSEREELREVNAELRAQLQELQSTEATARQRIDELLGRIEDLEAQQHAASDREAHAREAADRAEACEQRDRTALAAAQHDGRALREELLRSNNRVTELEELEDRERSLGEALAVAHARSDEESRTVRELRETVAQQANEIRQYRQERLASDATRPQMRSASYPPPAMTEMADHPSPSAASLSKTGPAEPVASGGVAEVEQIAGSGATEAQEDLAYSPVDGSPPSADATARAWFRVQYANALGHSVDDTEELERLAQPACRDARGVLEPAGGARGAPDCPTVDVIVCVHNALDDVRRCLWSLTAKTDYPFRLVVVNDGSGASTTRELERLAEEVPKVTVIHNLSPPHGYTIAANLGLRATEADYVVLLNSDTVVTPGWLDRIVACGEEHPEVGVLGPLSNAASHQSVPELREDGRWATNEIPAWMTADAMGMLVARLSPRDHPMLPFINGFCYAIKRAVLDRIGGFDEEHFASGYCEENDFSLRAAAAGFGLAVVDDAYVFHAKSRSYTVAGRDANAKRNYRILLDKHGADEVNRLVGQMEAGDLLEPLREGLRSALRGPEDLASVLHRDRKPLAVTFVLPGLGKGGSGGSHSIVQEVRGMRRLGIPARIALVKKDIGRARATYHDAEELFEPFADADDLTRRTSDADVLVITHFKSASMVADVWALRQDFLPAYYIQDYEPFFSTSDGADIAEAIASYTAIPGCLLFAKTHWLCNVVGHAHGLPVAKVEPSLDETLFHPRPREEGGPLRVAAMTRPRTPRRHAKDTVNVLERVAATLGGDIDVQTFGCEAADFEKLTSSPYMRARHRGRLGREEVATLLASVDVFLDLSVYQAFGRTALEAMASGATAIVPRVGGVSEFAVHGKNSLVIDTIEKDSAVEALCDLAADRDRLAALQEAARREASRYSLTPAALSEYLLFVHEHARRFSLATDTTPPTARRQTYSNN